MPTETHLRLRAATHLLNGYAEDHMKFSFDQSKKYYSITLENRAGRKPVYSETDNIINNVTPEQVAFDVAQSLHREHPSFAAYVVQDLQNKKDYYGRD